MQKKNWHSATLPGAPCSPRALSFGTSASRVRTIHAVSIVIPRRKMFVLWRWRRLYVFCLFGGGCSTEKYKLHQNQEMHRGAECCKKMLHMADAAQNPSQLTTNYQHGQDKQWVVRGELVQHFNASHQQAHRRPEEQRHAVCQLGRRPISRRKQTSKL